MERSALNKQRSISSSRGFVMIEAMVGVVLASVLLTAFLALSAQATKLDRAAIKTFEADMYLKELIEITKDLEQSNWNNQIANNAYCPLSNNASLNKCYPKIVDVLGKKTWTLYFAPDPSLEDPMFTRWLAIYNVCRSASTFPNTIVSTSDTDAGCSAASSGYDPNTKKITARISWTDGSHSPMILETYVYHNAP